MSSPHRERGEDIIQELIGKYKDVLTFRNFLNKHVSDFIVPELDIQNDIQCRLERTIIVPEDTFKPLLKMETIPRRDESLSSLVDGVVKTLVLRCERDRRLKQQAGNVLCQGFSVATDHHIQTGAQSLGAMTVGLVMIHLNNNVDYVKTSPIFESMHNIVGDNILRSILLNTSVFVPVESNFSQPKFNFLQIAGPRLRVRPTRKRKNGNISRGNSDQNVQLLPHSIVDRDSMFYSNDFIPKIGLPSRHILNTCSETSDLLCAMLRCNSMDKTTTHAGLSTDENRCLLDMCRNVIDFHRKCDYARLLNHYCPLPDVCTKSKGTIELSDAAASHTPSHCVSSFLRSVLRRVFPQSIWGTKENLDQLLSNAVTFLIMRRNEKMANKVLLQGIRLTKIPWLYTSSSKKVSRFNHNTRQLLLLQVLRWIFSSFIVSLIKTNFHVTESEFTGKCLIYYRKPAWSIFRSLSMGKLLTKQYREISAEEARERLNSQQMGFSRLRLLPKENGVRPIAMLSRREQLQLKPITTAMSDIDKLDEEIVTPIGPATKKRRLDEITSNSTTNKTHNRLSSTNVILSDAFSVLRYEYLKEERLFGAGLQGLHYFYPRYRDFINRVCPREYNTKLFFGSVDIHKCYDNINQQRLIGLICHILREPDYLLQKYTIMYCFENLDRVCRKQTKNVSPPESFEPFLLTAEKVANDYHSSVFVDGVSCITSKRNEILRQISEHLTSHLVVIKCRFGERYLMQRTGIPQGSVLSSLLCNLYYGEVERKLLGDDIFPSYQENTGTVSDNCLLARMIDDFLLVSTESSLVKRFLDILNDGDDALGIQINQEKTRVSDIEAVPNSLHAVENHKDFFPWCGLLFNVKTGEVQIDYTRFWGQKAGDSLTTGRICNEGKHLEMQMKDFIRPRCLPILFDPVINSQEIQAINFFQMMVLAAVKVVLYIESANILSPVLANVSFISESIDSTIYYGFRLIEKRLESSNNGANINLRLTHALWLGRKAFHDVFQCRHSFSTCRLAIKEKMISQDISKAGHLRRVVVEAMKQIELDKLLGTAER